MVPCTYSVVPADVDGDGGVDLYFSSIAVPQQALMMARSKM
jgi:hypothetical protein